MTNAVIEITPEGQISLEGDYKDNMTYKEALAYLSSYDFGTIGHPDMEDTNFIFVRPNGEFAFF